LFVRTSGGVVLAQELSARTSPAVIEEVIEQVTVVDDAPQEQPMSSQENFQDDVEEVSPDLSGKAEEVSSDVSSDDAATLQDEGMVDGTAEDPQDGLPEDDHGDGNLGGEETSSSEDVQSVEIDQNVQSIDLIEELPEVDFSEVLHVLEIALSEGRVSRDDRSGIITFLQS